MLRITFVDGIILVFRFVSLCPDVLTDFANTNKFIVEQITQVHPVLYLDIALGDFVLLDIHGRLEDLTGVGYLFENVFI